MRKKITLIIGLIFLLLAEWLISELPGAELAAIALIPFIFGFILISTLILLVRSWKAGILFSFFLISAALRVNYSNDANFLLYCGASVLLYVLFYLYKNTKLVLLSLLLILPIFLLGLKGYNENYIARTTNTILMTANDIQEICIRQLVGEKRYDNFYHVKFEPEIVECSVNNSEGILRHIPKSICKNMVSRGIKSLNEEWSMFASIDKIALNGKDFQAENCESENEMYFYLKTSDWAANEFYNNVSKSAAKEKSEDIARERRLNKKNGGIITGPTDWDALLKSGSIKCKKQEDCSHLGEGWFCDTFYPTVSYCVKAQPQEQIVDNIQYFYSSQRDEYNFCVIQNFNYRVTSPGCFFGNCSLSYEGAENYCKSLGKSLVDSNLLLKNCEAFKFLLEGREFVNYWTKDEVSIEIDSKDGLKCSVYPHEGSLCNNGMVICQ